MPDLLTPRTFQILLSLADGAELHGYAIIADVRDRTGGDVSLTASTLYAAIKRMLDAGWLAEVDAPAETGGAPRRCYRISKAGRQVAQREAERLAKTVAMARAKRLLPRRT